MLEVSRNMVWNQLSTAITKMMIHVIRKYYSHIEGGGGPVYIERIINSNACGVKQNRRFIKSCGEGIGPNAIIDYFEFHLVKNLIVEDPKYTVIEYLRGQTMIVPKDDVTLPVYDYYLGKKEFDSPKAQEAVIRRIWKVRR